MAKNTEIVVAGDRTLAKIGLDRLPPTILFAGEKASRRFVEFFTANIRNKNTRLAYARSVQRFFNWCEEYKLALIDIEPVHVAAYVEQHPGSKPSQKQSLAAIRMLFDWMVVGQIVAMNPASSVRGPTHIVNRSKTPVLSDEQARALLNSINLDEIIGLRDRALIGLMVFSFARVTAAVSMRVEDYFQSGKRCWFRLHEKGGKRHDVPAHHSAEEYLDQYLKAAGIGADKKAFLFPTVGRDRRLTNDVMTRNDALRMIKRRAKAAGIPNSTCCHTFRATGIPGLSGVRSGTDLSRLPSSADLRCASLQLPGLSSGLRSGLSPSTGLRSPAVLLWPEPVRAGPQHRSRRISRPRMAPITTPERRKTGKWPLPLPGLVSF